VSTVGITQASRSERASDRACERVSAAASAADQPPPPPPPPPPPSDNVVQARLHVQYMDPGVA
jgi:hypothetical protein